MSDSNPDAPIGLVNVSYDCFFNSAVQALYALRSFRDHVKNFDSHIPDDVKAVRSIKQLFRRMEAKSSNPLETHSCLMTINLPGHTENRQFDAQECMTHLVNLFYPRINDKSSSEHNQVPDDCLFLLEGEESIYCLNCDKQSNRYFKESLCHIEFPKSEFENSVQMKIERMTNNPYGERMDELFKCLPCQSTKTNGTEATRARTLMNLKKYIIIQLKTFDYDRKSQRTYKTVPNLTIEEQVNNILLGKLNLCAIVYHIGDSPSEGHYVTSVKENNIWYTCNDSICKEGVKLSCDPTDQDNMVPYLLIYEKDLECELPTLTNVTKPSEIEESNPMIISNNDDVDFLVDKCILTDEKENVINDKSSILSILVDGSQEKNKLNM